MAVTTPPLQFGAHNASFHYRDRRAAFGVAVRDGQVACVRIDRGPASYFDLPGGALEPGETEEAATIREFAEETGLVVQVDDLLVRVQQYLVRTGGEAVNNRGGVYRVAIVREDPARKTEDDHSLVWLDPVEALAELRHGSHAFAVAAWLQAEQAAAGYADGPALGLGGAAGAAIA